MCRDDPRQDHFSVEVGQDGVVTDELDHAPIVADVDDVGAADRDGRRPRLLRVRGVDRAVVGPVLEFLDELPRSPTGKVLREELK